MNSYVFTLLLAVPSSHLQLSSHCGNVQSLPTIMSNSISGSGSIIQYSNQEGSYYVPNDIGTYNLTYESLTSKYKKVAGKKRDKNVDTKCRFCLTKFILLTWIRDFICRIRFFLIRTTRKFYQFGI